MSFSRGGSSKNLYEILGLPNYAKLEKVSEAYQASTNAFKILSNPVNKKLYDKSLQNRETTKDYLQIIKLFHVKDRIPKLSLKDLTQIQEKFFSAFGIDKMRMPYGYYIAQNNFNHTLTLRKSGPAHLVNQAELNDLQLKFDNIKFCADFAKFFQVEPLVAFIKQGKEFCLISIVFTEEGTLKLIENFTAKVLLNAVVPPAKNAISCLGNAAAPRMIHY